MSLLNNLSAVVIVSTLATMALAYSKANDNESTERIPLGTATCEVIMQTSVDGQPFEDHVQRHENINDALIMNDQGEFRLDSRSFGIYSRSYFTQDNMGELNLFIEAETDAHEVLFKDKEANFIERLLGKDKILRSNAASTTTVLITNSHYIIIVGPNAATEEKLHSGEIKRSLYKRTSICEFDRPVNLLAELKGLAENPFVR